MRELAPVMEQEETRVSIEVARPSLVDSLEEIREVEAGRLYDGEHQHMPEATDIEERGEIGESGSDLDEIQAVEHEPEAGSFVFNTSARNVNLNDESLRLPGGLNLEERSSLVGIHLPNIDAKLEAGTTPRTVLSGIDEMVEEWNRNLPEDMTAKQREWAWAKNHSTGAFIKAYVDERLKDPETRALNRSEAFRLAHQRITQARTPEELNRAADAARGNDSFSERDRKLLFFGRAPDHHTPEMRELRRMWWLPQKERVEALKGRVETLKDGGFAPSPELKELVAELDSRNSAGRLNYFFSALKNPPEKMHKPEESARLGLWPKSQKLLSHERAYLLDLTWEKKQSLEKNQSRAGRHPSLSETAPRIEEPSESPTRASLDNESLRLYLAGVKEAERDLLEARQGLSRAERAEIHERACRMAWDRLAPPEVFAERPTEAARAIRDTIAELREKTQPQARLADQALTEFSLEKTGHPHGRIPQEALGKLAASDLDRLRELEQVAAATRSELYRGFERIDNLRREIELFRQADERHVERIAANEPYVRGDEPKIRKQAAPASREPEATAGIASKEASGRQTPPAGRSFGRPPRESPSYRKYTRAVAQIERQLVDEAVRQKQPTGKDGQEIAPSDGLLAREEKLRIRAVAADLAWERIEPREIFTNDPAAIELLSLSEAVARLRDEKQPRAREAAGKLDEFIRSRNLDSFAKEKTDYYYRADQISKSELQNLPPAEKREFAALKRQASATLREFKEGFRSVDRIRLEIEKAYNGSGKQAPPKTNRSIGGYHYIYNPLPGRDADPERDLTNDRRLLGDVIIAHALADCAMLDYEIARDHGRTFRLRVYDESLKGERRISDLDVNRRAGARGQRASDERGVVSGGERRAVRSEVSERDVTRHRATIEEHGRKLEKLTSELESKAQAALDAYQRARQLAQAVVEQYERRGEVLPTPLVEREALVKAQDEAIQHRFPGHTERLERLRVALAEEHGQELRPDREAAWLAAQLFTARTELEAREQHAARFDQTRHLRQWEIGGEKLSLAEIDRRIEQETDRAQFVGKREFHIFPGDRRQASEEVERLGKIREAIIEKTGQRQGELREKVSEAGKLLDTLTGAYQREASLRERPGLVMPAPQFTRQEIERAADNIETTREAAALRQLSLYERQFNVYANPKERFESAEGWGRAPARALMAEIFHREDSERLGSFRERGSLQPLLVETSRGLVTHRIKDDEPRSLVEMLVRPVVESPAQREIRQGAQAAFAQYESWLQADFQKTHSYLEAAREIASAQAAERTQRAGQELPAPGPVFAPKQAMTLEIYAERQADPEERKQLLALARGNVRSHFDSHSQTRSPEPALAREAAPGIGRGR